ncbi:alpha/beta hydrolase [Hymenobacter radiodurans]|uniref:alpha/beta hydrolase n=1 Tax=Hymenobacter radiodurans TaxID=2496028 RepID=UPI001058F17A|nr:alpha/beta fold hydrolase [Hymenobacter radiodurans]
MPPTETTAHPANIQYPSVPPGLKLLQLKFRVLSALSSEWAFKAAWEVFTTPRRLPLKTWETKALAHATQHWAQAESGRIAYYEWNGSGSRTVLLVHGWEHRASFWGHMADGLAKAGFRIVAVDGPAHGLSDGKRATLVSFAGAVQAVADAIGPVHATVAHSFGAACTAGVPVRFNQAIGGQLPRLVLMSAPSSTRKVAARFAHLLHLPPA